MTFFSLLFLFPGSRTPSQDFYFMYNIWQDAGYQTRVAATAARCATIELHTSSSICDVLPTGDSNTAMTCTLHNMESDSYSEACPLWGRNLGVRLRFTAWLCPVNSGVWLHNAMPTVDFDPAVSCLALRGEFAFQFATKSSKSKANTRQF